VAIARVVELAPRRPTAIRELGAGTTRAEMVKRHGANGVLSMGLFWENAPEPCCDESRGSSKRIFGVAADHQTP
jgi:hypothetical protein